MSYKIDKKVPLPDFRGGKVKYPFADMNPGDSFTVPDTEKLAARQASYAFGRRNGTKFAARFKDGENRIWRIA